MNLDERLKYLRNYVIFFMSLMVVNIVNVIVFAFLEMRWMMWASLMFALICLALGERAWRERFRILELRDGDTYGKHLR